MALSPLKYFVFLSWGLGLLFVPKVVFTQNLIDNGSFEDHTIAPASYGQWINCTGWNNVNLYPVFLYPYASPDYLHTLGSGGVGLPLSTFATLTPYHGNAVMGALFYSGMEPDFREYISSKLNQSMVPGKQYHLSFWITNGQPILFSGSSCNNLGVCFSVNPLYQFTHEPINRVPQLENTTQIWNSEWQNITFDFVPDSAYHYITIGNFRDDDHTTRVTQDPSAEDVYQAYYFFDAFEITTDDNGAAGPGICMDDCDSMLVPNVFTPNGDGLNDVFSLYLRNTASMRSIIYNRWGQAIYISDQAILLWDGCNTQGDPVSEGTYFVVVEQLTRSGQTYRRGAALTLVR